MPTGLEAVAWAREVERLGAGEIVLTSMDADGTKDGYDLEITAAVSEAVSIPVVASGGAGKPEHLADAITIGKADAALAASIFHFGEYTIEETKRVMAERGIPVRLDGVMHRCRHCAVELTAWSTGRDELTAIACQVPVAKDDAFKSSFITPQGRIWRSTSCSALA